MSQQLLADILVDRLKEEINPFLWISHDRRIWMNDFTLKQDLIHHLCVQNKWKCPTCEGCADHKYGKVFGIIICKLYIYSRLYLKHFQNELMNLIPLFADVACEIDPNLEELQCAKDITYERLGKQLNALMKRFMDPEHVPNKYLYVEFAMNMEIYAAITEHKTQLYREADQYLKQEYYGLYSYYNDYGRGPI